MKPITFSCSDTLPLTPEEIAGQILDLTNWTDFKGYGVLPGIKAAEFETSKPGVIGTRIRVTNSDESSHIEEIVEWEPDRRLRLDMKDFSPPLSRLATGSWKRGSSSDSTTAPESLAPSRCTRSRPSPGPCSGCFRSS